LKNLKNFIIRKNLNEAVRLLNKLGSRGAAIAGGTSLARMTNPNVEELVDISRLGLSYVGKQKKGIGVGAGTTFQTMVKSDILNKYAGGLIAKAASLGGYAPDP